MLLNTPRSVLGVLYLPNEATKMMSGLVGWMRIFEIPCDSPKPTWVHVFPASRLRYTPSPGMMFPRMQVSPIPMKTRLGLVSLTATAPTDALRISPSVTGPHVSPPSVVFHNPPPVAPKYASLGRPFTPVAAMERPPRSGPMLRHRYPARNAESRVTGARVVDAGRAAGALARPVVGWARRRSPAGAS